MKLIAILLVFITFVSCQKDIDEFEPYIKTAISFPEVVNLKPIYKEFDASVRSEIDLGDGEVIIVPANSIVDQSGQTLSGKIDLNITQIHKKSELIYAYMNSNVKNGDNGQLDNYHTINIKAYHDAKEVFVKEGKEIILKAPSDANIITGLVWAGQHYSSNNYGWDEMTSNVLTKDTWTMNGTTYDGVAYTTNTFGWISGANELMSGGHKLRVSLIEGIDAKKTKVYFIFNDAFSVAELKILSDSEIFCGTIPSGAQGQLIVINEEATGVYRFQNETLTIAEETDFVANPQVSVLENILTYLNSL